MFGCFELTHKADGTAQILFKGVPVRSSFKVLVDVLTVYNKFDGFLQSLFAVSQRSRAFLESSEVVLGFHLYDSATFRGLGASVDLIGASTDKMLLRIKDAEELDVFVHMFTASDPEKMRAFQSVLGKYSRQTENLFDPVAAKKAIKRALKVDIDIPSSVRGFAPDYETLKDTIVGGLPVVYKVDDNHCITKIFYSSSRSVDFRLAFEKMGMKAAEIAEAQKYYVWHHLDDWDPVTGEGTMRVCLPC